MATPGEHLGADALVGEQLEEDGVVLAAVDDGGAGYAALDGLEAGGHLRHHPAGQARHQLGQRLGRDLADDVVAVGPVAVEPLDVGEHEQLLGAEGDRERGGRGVGVHVVHGAVDVRSHREMTGIRPASTRSSTDSGRTLATSPTRPRSTSSPSTTVLVRWAVNRPASSPERPTASGPCSLQLIFESTDLCTGFCVDQMTLAYDDLTY